jgi:uncharacterized protein
VKRGSGLILLAVLMIAVWLAAPDLPSPARLLALVLVTIFPAAALVQGSVAHEVPPGASRFSIYLTTSIALCILAAVTIGAVLASGFTLEALGLVGAPAGQAVAWTLGVVAAGILWMVAARSLPTRETSLLRFMLPRSGAEKVAFAGVSLSAGICEEIVFRGFLIPALEVILGSLPVAVIVSSLVFGLVHAYQGPLGVLRTGTLGLFLAIPFVVTGSLVPSMAAHFIINIVAGVFLAEWLLRERLTEDPSPDAAGSEA